MVSSFCYYTFYDLLFSIYFPSCLKSRSQLTDLQTLLNCTSFNHKPNNFVGTLFSQEHKLFLDGLRNSFHQHCLLLHFFKCKVEMAEKCHNRNLHYQHRFNALLHKSQRNEQEKLPTSTSRWLLNNACSNKQPVLF